MMMLSMMGAALLVLVETIYPSDNDNDNDNVDVEYDVAALVYTIYPIDAGAAFVTPLLLLQPLLSLTATLLLIHLTTNWFKPPIHRSS